MGKLKVIRSLSGFVGFAAILLILSGCANPFTKTADEACGPITNPGTITKEAAEKLGVLNNHYIFMASQPLDYIKCRDEYDDVTATYVLGLFYLEGYQVEKDVKKAIALFSETGPRRAEIGHYYSAPTANTGGSMETYTIRSAREGLPEGRYQLGKIFVYGLNGEVNMDLGLWHLEIAALQGYQQAVNLLAELPWDGVLDGKINSMNNIEE